MVNVNQYQIVATAQTVAACESSYREMLVQSNIIDEDKGNIEEPAPEFEMEEKIGTIDEIRSAVINGNTYYYISLEGEDFIGWRVSAADDPSAPLMDVGDTVGLSYIPGNANLDWTERYSWKEVYALDLLPDNR